MPNTIHSDEYKKVIQKLKSARMAIGFSQKEVAKKLDKSQSYISKVEAGEQRIDVIELNAFASLYMKKLDYFL